MKSFSISARGRVYTVTTEALGTALTMNGFWTYQPSVILPCPLTGDKYVLLLNRNKVSGSGEQSGEVITARTSSTPDNFGPETTILDNSDGSVDNVCDMADARPIWDGSQWHIYVQAGPGPVGATCPDVANIYEAVGASLNPPGQFQWVKVPGTNSARAIVSGTGSFGIGEDMQWYNPGRYGLPSYPFMVTYNDWGYLPCGNCLFNYLSQDDLVYNYWYGPEPTPFLVPPNFAGASYLPDAILLASLDVARKGDPGTGFESHCYEGPNPRFTADHRYQYGKGIGFFNNPSKVPFTSPQTAWAFPLALESVSEDAFGPRMFRPRVARNEYGYIPPQSYHGYPRTWVTYLYYTYSQINRTAGSGCDGYDQWDASPQSIGVSRLTITERSAQH